MKNWLSSILCAIFLLTFQKPAIAAEEKYFPCPTLFDPWCPPICAIDVELDFGYKKFYFFPKYSYGYLVTTGAVLHPFPFFTFEDEPESPYGQGYISFTIAEEDLPFRFGTPLTLGVGGTLLQFNQSLMRNINFVSGETFDVELPSVTGTFSSNYAVAIGDFYNGYQDRKYVYSNVEVFLRAYNYFFVCCTPFSLEPQLSFMFERFEQKMAHKWNLVVVSVSNEYSQNMRTNFYDFGGGFRLSTDLSCWLNLFAQGNVYGSYLESDLSAREVILNPPLSPIFLSVKDKKHTWGCKFKGRTGFNILWGRYSFGVTGEYEYWNQFPAYKNPQIIDATFIPINPTEITFDPAANYTILGTLGIHY